MKDKFKESFLIGAVSFLGPFLGAMFYAHYVLHTQSGSTAVQITTHAPCTVILAQSEKKKK